jgi:PAS domain S-box-containing protein
MIQNDMIEVFKALPTPIVVLMAEFPKFTIIEANDAYQSFVGKDLHTLVGKGFFEVSDDMPSERKELWAGLLKKVMEDGGKNQTPALRLLNVPGSRSHGPEGQFVFTHTPIFNEAGDVRLIIGSVEEVAAGVSLQEHKVAFSNEQFLYETQRIARVGGWDADLVRNMITWSDMVKEIYEVEPDYQPEMEFSENFYKPGIHRDHFISAIQEAVAKGTLIDLETVIVTAKGKERWIRITGQAVFTDGICTRIYGAIQDIHDQKMVEEELIESHNKFESLVQTIDGIVWEADAVTFQIRFVSDQIRNILGYDPGQWLNDAEFWKEHIHPEDRERVPAICQRQTLENRTQVLVYRMIRADGAIVWIRDFISVIRENGKAALLRGLMLDITETKRLEDMEHLEKTILERNSSGRSNLVNLLNDYLLGIERIFPQMKSAIFGIKNNRLQKWASPSLPESYTSSIENVEIGELQGSCGSAAYRKERVVVSDIAGDFRWVKYRETALRHGLRACWSHPIVILDGQAVATFAVYYDKIKSPDEEEIKVIDRAAAILTVILENRHIADMASETTMLMTQGQELARFGNWQWDVETNMVTWSDTLYTIYGLSKKSFSPSLAGYLSKVHPDDRERVSNGIRQALELKGDFEFEERIIHSSGEERHLKTWGKTKTDDKGQLVKMIGACLDITDSKKIQKELLASEARLRSLVDSQTIYVIRTDLAGNYTYYNNKFNEEFGWFYGGLNFIGVNCMQIVRQYEKRKVVETVAECLANPGVVCPLEVDHISPGFEQKSAYWHFIALTDQNGFATEIQCIGIDVSERKQAVEALKKSNERYELLNKATDDAVYDWDMIRDHIHWGDGFSRMFGFETDGEQYPLERWAQHVHPADRGAIEEGLLKHLDDPRMTRWTGKYRFLKADDTYSFIEETGYIRRNRAGRAVGMIGVLRDVTERVRYINEIEERNQKLQEIAWMQSHVIRAPLARLMGLIDLIKNYQNTEEESDELLAHVLTSANALDEIIRDISSKAAWVDSPKSHILHQEKD